MIRNDDELLALSGTSLVASGGSIPAVKSWLIITSPSPASKHLNTDIPVSRTLPLPGSSLGPNLELMTLLSAPTNRHTALMWQIGKYKINM